MSQLKKQIKCLEASITANNNFLWQQISLFQEKTHTSRIIIVAMVASFVYGFTLIRRKTLLQAGARLAASVLSLRRLYNSFKAIQRLFISFIKKIPN